MDLVRIYQCLCDLTRLRILNLLAQGPLCVCHIQDILREPQVKVSKHLGYLKTHGMVESRREATWRIYRLVARAPQELKRNLKCLQDCAREDPQFRRDLDRLRDLQAQGNDPSLACCVKPVAVKTKAAR